MDIASHGLWVAAALGRKSKKDFWTAFFFGLAPDALSVGIFWISVFLGFDGRPNFKDGHLYASMLPQYLQMLYNATHSLVIFAVIFMIIWVILKRPYWLLSAWGIHILIDIPTHSEKFFPTPFLWPVNDYKVFSLSWSDPRIFIPNLILLAIVYGWWGFSWRKNNKHKWFSFKLK